MQDESLSKKEKRQLAKEEKNKEKNKENLVGFIKKFSGLALVILALFAIVKLSSAGNISSGLEERFKDYATESGLDSQKFVQDYKNKEVNNKINQDITSGNALGINATPTFFLNGEKLETPNSYEAFKTLIEKAKTEKKENTLKLLDNDHAKGNKDSGVILIEYSDFQCPACKQYQPIINKLVEEYKSDILFVYRHFPLLSIHVNAYPAAKASEAAGAQGKFWEMHDILFEKQEEWANL